MSEPTPRPEFPPYECTSFLPEVRGERTGFFHVEQHGGRWLAIDPLGRGFVPLGVDHVNFKGHQCERLGCRPYEQTNLAKYGDIEPWARQTISRLQQWGFNLVAAGSSPELFRRGLAHVGYLHLGQRFSALGPEHALMEYRRIPGTAMPNVFHPDFADFCDREARRLAADAADPWLFGYFLDNELRWWGECDFHIDTGPFDAAMNRPREHAARQAAVAFLAERYDGDVRRFNEARNASLEAFDQLLERPAPPTDSTRAYGDKKAFAGLVARRYFQTTTEAVRRYDPNHMILGCRFAAAIASDSVLAEAGRFCEVVAFNYYPLVNLEHGVAMNRRSAWAGPTLHRVFENTYAAAQRPLMVTEWSFPALDAGLPSARGAGQRFRTQAERTEATRICAETMLRTPSMIGYDFFMWVDEPALGISLHFPEDSNYGLVNERDEPYAELTAMFTDLHRRAGRLRMEGFAEPPRTPSPCDSPGTRRPASVCCRESGTTRGVTAGQFELSCGTGEASLLSSVAFDGVQLGRIDLELLLRIDGAVYAAPAKVVDCRGLNGEASPATVELRCQCTLQEAVLVSPTGNYHLGGNHDFVGPRGPGLTHATTPSRDQSASLPPGHLDLAVQVAFHGDLDALLITIPRFGNQSLGPVNIDGVCLSPIPASQRASIREGDAGRIWGPVLGDAWHDPATGTFWGFAAPRHSVAVIDFCGCDPAAPAGAFWPLFVAVPPGETFEPQGPPFAVCLAGQGNRHDWERRVGEVLRTIELPPVVEPTHAPLTYRGGTSFWV